MQSQAALKDGIGTQRTLGAVDSWDEVVPHVGFVEEGTRYAFLATPDVKSHPHFDQTKTWRTYRMEDGTQIVLDQFAAVGDTQPMPGIFGRVARGEYADQESARRRRLFLERHVAYIVYRMGDTSPKKQLVEEALAQLLAWRETHPSPVQDDARVIRSGMIAQDRERGGDSFLPQV